MMTTLAPIPTEFTSIVATRQFHVICAGSTTTLVFEVGLPIQDVETAGGFDWRCPVRIIDGSSVRDRRACGADSYQALQLGLRLVQDEVQAIAQAKNCQVLLFDSPYDGAI
jgi:hypothetical protein